MLHSFDASSFVWTGKRFSPQYPRDFMRRKGMRF